MTDQINALTQVQLEEAMDSFGLITGSLRQLQQDDDSQNVVPGAPRTAFRQLHKRSSPPVLFALLVLPLIRTTCLTSSCEFLEFPY